MTDDAYDISTRMDIIRDIVADLRTKAHADPSMPLWQQIGMSVLAAVWLGEGKPPEDVYGCLVEQPERPRLTVVDGGATNSLKGLT